MNILQAAGENRRVLIADDEPTVRMLLATTLESYGFTVDTAEDGVEALRLFSENRPDFILLDVVMPRMDGFHVCSAVRRMPQRANVPILMLTGLGDFESISKAFDAGATDFATKPFSPLVLTHRILYLLKAQDTLDELRRSKDLLASAQRIAHLGNWELEIATGNLVCSEEACRLLGSRENAPCGIEGFLECVHPADRQTLRSALDEAVRSGQSFGRDHRILLPDGQAGFVHSQAQTVRAEDGRVVRLIGTIQDISSRIEAEERIRTLAFYDQLTGLANRHLFDEKVELALKMARRRRIAMAMLFVDVDQFKRINDTFGHSVGDKLLQGLAQRLSSLVRSTDPVMRPDTISGGDALARLGGDEFILALSEVAGGEDAARVARRILDSSKEPFQIDGHEIVVTMSIGISMFPDDGEQVEPLLKNADTAMYRAKDSGRNNYQFYDKSMSALVFQRLCMETSLRKALERNEFELYFQPQVDVQTGLIFGVEALIRWNHPELGVVLPGEFIVPAEEMGLIRPIGEWVIQAACAQLKRWHEAGSQGLRVAVNLSGRQLERGAFSKLTRLLVGPGMDPASVEFEITESVIMRDADLALQLLREIKSVGVRITVDDFGTGYSSLSYLKHFPVDALKIDRSFVREVALSTRDAAITETVIRLSHRLGMEVIAEGVETAEQRDILNRQGCRLMQGYFFGHPMTAGDLSLVLQKDGGRISAVADKDVTAHRKLIVSGSSPVE